MAQAVSAPIRVLACERGSTLVGYSSLALLVAIAAITLLARPDVGTGAVQRPASTLASE